MKLTALLLALLVFAVVAVALVALAKQTPGRRATGDLRARRPLTDREQAMYFRLTTTFPDRIVLAQVAFSALLESRDRPTRSTFDRKVADFVLCSKDFSAVAVIELDDASHQGRAGADSKRDALLVKAGYRVVRFKNVPDAADLLAAFAPSA